MVGIDLGKCFQTVAESRPGNVVRNPVLIAFVHVLVVGLHEARWRYVIKSVLVQRE